MPGGIGLLAVLAIGYFLGVNVTPLLNELGFAVGSGVVTEADERAAEFVSGTVADTEEVWDSVFVKQVGREYRPATRGSFSKV